MKCDKCDNRAVIEIEDKRLCKDHFILHFEETAMDTIKKYSLIKSDEKVAVANSGGKDSLSLLLFLCKYFDRNKIISITIDEGIPGYRDKTIEIMRRYTERLGVKYFIFSYKELFGSELSNIVKLNGVKIPCDVCGAFRRYALNFAAKKLGADKLATAHNLDDEAESIAMNLIQKDVKRLFRIGPSVGLIEDEMLVQRIKPFIFIHEKETMLYAILNNIYALHEPCPYTKFGIRHEVSEWIKKIEDLNPGAKRRMVESAINIKRNKAIEKNNLNHCKICGFPSSGEICEACSYRISYGLLSK
ncbi:MAG: TIGR00269 family protein [Conexivisphaerales archaeon]